MVLFFERWWVEVEEHWQWLPAAVGRSVECFVYRLARPVNPGFVEPAALRWVAVVGCPCLWRVRWGSGEEIKGFCDGIVHEFNWSLNCVDFSRGSRGLFVLNFFD